ncbi:MAG TPA: DUF1795 domain-containing protein, partial [Clostridiales bacterium]|nr:DUF1795 domain-containing protein [Clostridiales bacterium]
KEKETETEKKSDIVAGFAEDGTYTSAKGYSIKLPAGWTEISASEVMDALSDASGNNVTFISMASDAQFKMADEAFFKDTYIPSLGDAVDFKSYELVEISGHKAHKLKFTNTAGTMVMHQSQAFIEVDGDIFMFTYTDIDGSHPEVFENAMDSLIIID